MVSLGYDILGLSETGPWLLGGIWCEYTQCDYTILLKDDIINGKLIARYPKSYISDKTYHLGVQEHQRVNQLRFCTK